MKFEEMMEWKAKVKAEEPDDWKYLIMQPTWMEKFMHILTEAEKIESERGY